MTPADARHDLWPGFQPGPARMASVEASGQLRTGLTTGKTSRAPRSKGMGCRGQLPPMARNWLSVGEDMHGASASGNLGLGRSRRVRSARANTPGSLRPSLGVAFQPRCVGLLPRAARMGRSGIWDLATGPAPHSQVLQGHQQAVRCVAFHPRETSWPRQLLTGPSASGTPPRGGNFEDSATSAIAWTVSHSARRRADRDRLPRSLGKDLGHRDRIAAGILSRSRCAGLRRDLQPDGTKLASSSQDATVKIWDLKLGAWVCLLSLKRQQQDHHPGPIDQVGGLTFRPDGLEPGHGRRRAEIGRLEPGDGQSQAGFDHRLGSADGRSVQPGRTMARCLRVGS